MDQLMSLESFNINNGTKFEDIRIQFYYSKKSLMSRYSFHRKSYKIIINQRSKKLDHRILWSLFVIL